MNDGNSEQVKLEEECCCGHHGLATRGGRGLWLVVGDPEVRARGGYGVMDFGVLLLLSS